MHSFPSMYESKPSEVQSDHEQGTVAGWPDIGPCMRFVSSVSNYLSISEPILQNIDLSYNGLALGDIETNYLVQLLSGTQIAEWRAYATNMHRTKRIGYRMQNASGVDPIYREC